VGEDKGEVFPPSRGKDEFTLRDLNLGGNKGTRKEGGKGPRRLHGRGTGRALEKTARKLAMNQRVKKQWVKSWSPEGLPQSQPSPCVPIKSVTPEETT